MEELTVKNNKMLMTESLDGSLTSELVLSINATSESAVEAVSAVYRIEESYKSYKACYSDLVEQVANVLHHDMLNLFDGIKSYNDLVIRVTGCARSTASELVKVASKLYTTTMIVDEENDDFQNVVSQIDDRLDGYTFSEQVMLSNLSEDQLNAVLDELDEENHTRDDVRKAVKAVKGTAETAEKKTNSKDDKIAKYEAAIAKIRDYTMVKSGSRKDLIDQISAVLAELDM